MIEENKMMAEPEVMRNDGVSLAPASMEDFKDYVILLASKDKLNKTPREQLERGLELVRYMWVGGVNGTVGGVFLVSYLPNVQWWTLDIYDDKVLSAVHPKFCETGGRMVMQWFFENHPESTEVHTTYPTSYKHMVGTLERLGFKRKYTNDQFVIMHKRAED